MPVGAPVGIQIGGAQAGQSGHAGFGGSQPRDNPGDLLPGDERPGQRSVAKAFARLAAARASKSKEQRKRALHSFLNALGERQDTSPAEQSTTDAEGASGGASTFFGHG